MRALGRPRLAQGSVRGHVRYAGVDTEGAEEGGPSLAAGADAAGVEEGADLVEATAAGAATDPALGDLIIKLAFRGWGGEWVLACSVYFTPF